MAKVAVVGARLLKTINALSKIGRQADGGITRTTFSDADLEARSYVCDLMAQAGLEVRTDPFANIIGTLEGSSRSQVVLCGSHIDTVPNGGSLDGSYGVLAAIEAVRTVLEHGIRTRNGIEVVAFTEEEGVRFPSFLGSLGFSGALLRRQVYSLQDRNRISFRKALADAGFDSSELVPAHKSLDEIKAYVELHIEQGKTLEESNIPVGVVDSIMGLGEMTIEVEGRVAHAGTTPMALRRDALLGASRILLEVEHIARTRRNSVATVGTIDVIPNDPNLIPSKVTLGIDFRDSTITGLKFLRDEIVSASQRIGKQAGLKVTISERSHVKPAIMSRSVVKEVISCTNSLGLRYKIMRSGAGHDCQNMAAVTKAGMIFVPSIGGVSHSSSESTSPENLEIGANVLLGTLLRLADMS